MHILVTGGAGYIGSHAVRRLLTQGHEVVVLDNLSNGHTEALHAAAAGLPRQAKFVHADLGDRSKVMGVLRAYAIEAVLHFAGSIEVAESVRSPLKYYRNNFCNSILLLEAILASGVRRFVFSSTAAVYGWPDTTPINEDHPLAPVTPYGQSKRMIETAIKDCAAGSGLRTSILRYFNVAGAHPEGLLGEAHHPETHLIPRILSAAARETDCVEIFGSDYATPDGTCVRDYIHIEDLIDAHLLALDCATPNGDAVYNLGSECGFSVRQVIDACERVTGARIPVRASGRRDGDPPVLVASSRKIRHQLGWHPRYPDLDTMIRHSWAWRLAHPRGYHA